MRLRNASVAVLTALGIGCASVGGFVFELVGPADDFVDRVAAVRESAVEISLRLDPIAKVNAEAVGPAQEAYDTLQVAHNGLVQAVGSEIRVEGRVDTETYAADLERVESLLESLVEAADRSAGGFVSVSALLETLKGVIAEAVTGLAAQAALGLAADYWETEFSIPDWAPGASS